VCSCLEALLHANSRTSRGGFFGLLGFLVFWCFGFFFFFPFFLCSSFGFGFVCVGLSLTSLMTSTMRVTLSKAGRFSFCAISRLRDLS